MSSVPHQSNQLTTLTVLTLNTHKGFSAFNRRFMLHDLREAVRSVRADIVFLQEVLGSHELYASQQRDWPVAPQYEFLADSIWSHYSYGRNAVYPQGHHGNALLSLLPIVQAENHDVSTPGPESRGLLHCRLQRPERGTDLHVICVHLGLRERDRDYQIGRLCDLVSSQVPAGAPLIVAGDFNDWRQRAGATLEKRCGLGEAFAELCGRPARSFPVRLPLLRLDRVYTRNLRVHRPRVLARKPWTHLSDHAALAVDITL